nr:MAG TPA: hypothetical protein [Caudoviricetes sp.]
MFCSITVSVCKPNPPFQGVLELHTESSIYHNGR